MPGLNDLYPNSLGWVVTVLVVGALITVVAAYGYKVVARIANIAAPWMVLVFIAYGIVGARQLGITSLGEFWPKAQELIWTGGAPLAGPDEVHLLARPVLRVVLQHGHAHRHGRPDRLPLRAQVLVRGGDRGRHVPRAFHRVAGGIDPLRAAAARQPGEHRRAARARWPTTPTGVAGLICVIVAGWTTANPTIYRAGLAFQAIAPSSSRYRVTLLTGALATVAGLFPAIAMKLLDFVALYGLVLMPMGAVIFVDFWLAGRFGFRSRYAEAAGVSINWAAGLAWVLTLAGCLTVVGTGRAADSTSSGCPGGSRPPSSTSSRAAWCSERRCGREDRCQARLARRAGRHDRAPRAVLHRPAGSRRHQVVDARRHLRVVRRDADLDGPLGGIVPSRLLAGLVLMLAVASPSTAPQSAARAGGGGSPIDRRALVTRHHPSLTTFDVESPLSVGNGEFAFTVDATGLQTFADAYEQTIPLGTLSQWGWHSWPNPDRFSIDTFAFKTFDSHGRQVGYADIPGERTPEIDWLRANPHRLHLGRIGFALTRSDGSAAAPADLTDIRQTLDLWNGVITSHFRLDGEPVDVETLCHPTLDAVAVRVQSPLLASGRVKIDVRFPYGTGAVATRRLDQAGAHTTLLTQVSPTDARFDAPAR